jgi:lysyl-tRNA synthetase class II
MYALCLLKDQVIMVGRLVAKNEEAFHTIFEIEDGTGSMQVIIYHKEKDVTPKALKNFEFV